MTVNLFFVTSSLLSIFLYLGNYIFSEWKNFVSLIPVNVFVAHYYTWNLVTSSFYEESIIKLIISLGILYHITRKLEITNFETFGIFFVATTFACGLLSAAYCFIRFFGTQIDEMITDPMYGISGVVITLSVFARQQLRNESVIMALPFLTYHNLAIVIILIQLCFWIIGLGSYVRDLTFSIISLLFSWSFLRFYYRYDYTASNPPKGGLPGGPSSGYGDSSEDFSFVSMFPSVCHPVVVPLSTAFYNLFALSGIFPELEKRSETKQTHHHLRGGGSSSQAQAGGSSGNSAAASASQNANDIILERRRAKAIKLLDAKMAELAKEAEDGWDTTATTLGTGSITTTAGGGGGGSGGGSSSGSPGTNDSGGSVDTVTDTSTGSNPFTLVVKNS